MRARSCQVGCYGVQQLAWTVVLDAEELWSEKRKWTKIFRGFYIELGFLL